MTPDDIAPPIIAFTIITLALWFGIFGASAAVHGETDGNHGNRDHDYFRGLSRVAYRIGHRFGSREGRREARRAAILAKRYPETPTKGERL